MNQYMQSQGGDIVIGADPQRIALERGLALIGANLSTYLVTEKALIIEFPLVAGLNSYEKIIKESNNGRPLEVRLNHNDVFILTHIGMAVRKQDESTTPAQYGNFKDFTFADGNYFVGDNGAGNTEAAALQTLWNARFTINANGVDIIDGAPTNQLEYVPERGTIIAAAPQVANEAPMSGSNLESQGFRRYPMNHVLLGQRDNKVKLSGIDGDTTLIAGAVNGSNVAVNTRNVLRLMLHGFEVSGAADAALAYLPGR